MTTVTIKATNVASFPGGGGHFWVFAQYAHALKQLGCRVQWLERFVPSGSPAHDRRSLHLFSSRLAALGLADDVIVYERPPEPCHALRYLTATGEQVEALLLSSDLLLNFDYGIETELREQFRVTALVDIDPGLLQFWVSAGQVDLPPHDLHLTIGETVGTGDARFPDLCRSWLRFRPPVCLDLWPFVHRPRADAFTTVSGWWGGNGRGEWITDGTDVFFENNKRVSFLQFVDLPSRGSQAFELALALGDGDEALAGREPATVTAQDWVPLRPPPSSATDYVDDAVDRRRLLDHGWRVRRAAEVAGSPSAYRRYIQASRGEFSCAKPSCMYFANAWVSDRTICYLASGKPVIVQDTGPSAFLPNGHGMFRFSDIDGAMAAVDAINTDYRGQCDAARDVARTLFDGPTVLGALLDEAFAGARR